MEQQQIMQTASATAPGLPEYKLGSMCVAVSYGRVRGRARNYRYYEPVVYEAKALKDGTLVWILAYACGHARRSYRLAAQDAEAVAVRLDCEMLGHVRQYNRVDPVLGVAL